MSKYFLAKGRKIQLGKRSLIMGVLNTTPDSFSDGGQFNITSKALDHSLRMLEEGADIIDIGGESTRPGSDPVSEKEELKRVIPVITELKRIKPDCIISIDTQKTEVAKTAIDAGADIINDVSGLQNSKKIAVVSGETGAGLILMHMLGTPKTMQNNIKYQNFLADIKQFLLQSAETAISIGVDKTQIMIDPGIGFGKTLEHNLRILANISLFKDTGFPVLVGPSRKAFIGKLTNEEDPLKREWGTAGAIAYLAAQKTDVVRVHNVKGIKQLLTVFEAVHQFSL